MKLRNLFLGAIAMVAAFSACEEQADEALGGNPSIELVGLEGDEISFDADGGESQVALIANRNWTIEEDATWIEVTPTSGSASGDQQVVTIKVLKNELDEDDPTAGFDREDDIKFTVGAKSTYLTIKQAGPQGSTEALVVYYNNFDVEGQKAEKNEEGKWATYLDSFEGWKNETGTGTESVTYAFESITARTNSSNGSAGSQYSIYDGSGMNYLWFGSGKPYLVVKDITLPEGKVDFKISFGSERYLYEAENNTFNWDEFKAYVSIDGAKWSVPAWEFAGEELPDGKWDLASAVISVPEGTTKLYLYFAASMASAYALDDLKVEESLVAGTVIDFANGEEITPGEAEEGGESDAAAIYSNNYDKLEAKKEYGGSGNSYPYLDQFDGWMNHAGTGASNVTYAFSGMSARANSYSNGSYSDYEGSGLNNLFFGSNAYFATNNIELNGATDLTLTFGTEKYSQDNGSVFTNSEYHIWLSNDGGQKWVEFTDYTFAGGTTEGRWNVATANFTVPAGTETISICMQVDVASSYRLDDFNLIAATTAGTAVDFSQAVEKDFSEVTPEQGGESDAAAIYSNNYDKTEATKTYGSSGNSYPYLDQFDGWMNHAGTGASNVTYAFSGMSARSNSTSDGTYSDYEGSGMNNIFFGKSAYFATNNIVLDGATDLTLTFGTEKYSQTDGSVFTNSEYHIWLSNDGGKKWVEFTDYTFAGGTKEGRWNVATANFTVPAGTETLSICMQVDVASAYRLDDFKLVTATTAGTAVDFSNAVAKDFGAGGSTGEGGTTTPEGTGEGTQANPYDALKAHGIAATLGANDKITGVYVKGKISEIKEVSTSYGNATYWITDPTGAAKFYVYRGYALGNTKFTAVDEIKVGDEVLIYGDLMNYMGDSPQLGQGNYIVELNSGSGEGGGETPDVPVVPGEVNVVTVAQFNAATDNNVEYQVSGTISGIYQAYNSQYGNISLYISDETGEMLAYRLSCEGITDPANTLTKGDLITVRGMRTLYDSKPQMAQGGVIVEHTDVEVEVPEGAVTLSFADAANRTVFTTNQQVWEQNGIRLINDKGASTSNVADYVAPARFYKSSKLTVEYAGMTKIEFVCNNGTYASDLKSSITEGTATVNGSVVTVVLSAAVDTYEIAKLAAQVRMDSLTVYAE